MRSLVSGPLNRSGSDRVADVAMLMLIVSVVVVPAAYAGLWRRI
jgi:hypothetical protein